MPFNTVTEIENAREGNSYAHITTSTTTQVKTGAGYLVRIIVCLPHATNTITVIDNTTGSTPVILAITDETSAVPRVYECGIAFTTGLRVTTAGSTADDITVVYR